MQLQKKDLSLAPWGDKAISRSNISLTLKLVCEFYEKLIKMNLRKT